MQDEESDQNTNHRSIRDETEENDQPEAATPKVVIEANTDGSRLYTGIEVTEQVITRSDKTDGRKPKLSIKLPNDIEHSGPSCNIDIIGDDGSKVKEQDILCECEPKGTGGAVPMVVSLDMDCLENQDFEGTSTNESIQGRSGTDFAENETIIRDITSATTSSVIIPPPKQSTISSDSSSSENSASTSETKQSAMPMTDSSFVIEYVGAVSSLNVTTSPTNKSTLDDGNLASLESLAKKESFSTRTRNSQPNNKTVKPTSSLNADLKKDKADKNVKKTPPSKINPDLFGSRLVIPTTTLAPKRELKAQRNGVMRNTASPKVKLPAIKGKAESPISDRGYKNVQSTDNVRPSSSTYGRYPRKEISSSLQRGFGPNAKDKINHQDGEGALKRPSMIPKPRTTSTNVQKTRPTSKIDLRRKDKPSDYNLVPKIDPGRRVTYGNEASSPRTVDTESAKENEELSKSSQTASDTPDAATIHTRMVGLQERLKATTTMIRNRMGSNCKPLPDTEDGMKNEPEQTSEPILPKTASVTLKDLYKNIFEMKETALRLSDSTSKDSQKEHIEKLLMNIKEIQRIADNLLDSENSGSSVNDCEVSGGKDATIKSNKTKDNKIIIKFTQLKDKQKRKEDGEVSNQSDEGCKSNPGTMTDLEAGVIEKVKTEASLKDADSMDGMFIPSQEPFIHNIEEEEESNGLDITITFPELNHLLSEQNESHLSVRLSDISAEALRKLKRCPKDFTLRMDFVQGKVHFQSGTSPVNNFSIGPDLKFIEYPMDDRKSDMISIKRSTECSYGSQLISVDNRDERGTSYKSLKSTDSELFNVVNLPFLYRDATLGTVTRSCMTLRKERMMSMAIVARQFFKSMPQIPSLTYIQEENNLENAARMTGPRKEAEKSCIPKKRDRTQRQQLAMIADEVE